MRHVGEALAQLVDQARLADAGLADDEHGLPLAVLRALPAIDSVASSCSRPTNGVRRARGDGEPAPHAARPVHDAVERDRLGDALELLRPPRSSTHEDARHEPLRGAADDHACRARPRACEPRGDVRRVADGEGLAAGAAAHRSDHDRPGVDADARRRSADAVLGLERVVQASERGDDLEPGAHGALGVVLVGLRIAEVHEQTVAEVLRDVPRVAFDRRGAASW